MQANAEYRQRKVNREMKKWNKRKLRTALGLLGAFVLWTGAVSLVDVQAIGPEGTCVGLAALNRFIHSLTGVHLSLYAVTDWLGLVPVGFAAGFALLGLVQWVRRKSLLKVDADILLLGGFYMTVMAAYVFFELWVVNYRPVLIGGRLEASYPSSTTMLALCVMPTAVMQLNRRNRNPALRRCAALAMTAFTVLLVILRLASGVHWFTDITGGVLLSGGLVMLYAALL